MKDVEKRTLKQKRFVCRICKENIKIDYKDTALLRKFISDTGKILPRRITKNCAKHQRRIAHAIKKARNIALLPYTVK